MATENYLDPKPKTAESGAKKRNKKLKHEIDLCKARKRKILPDCEINIDYRRGKPFASASDEDRIAVNHDWPMTKAKQSALFSQVPKARTSMSPEVVEAGPSLLKFEQKLNENLIVSGIEATMDEVLPDEINAYGLGIAMVSYEALMEDKEVPLQDISTLPPEAQEEFKTMGTIGGQPPQMTTVPVPTDRRYVIQRISFRDFLWPLTFKSSDFNRSTWLGRSGKITWAEAVQKYKVTEEEKTKLTGDTSTDVATQGLHDDPDASERNYDEEWVGFDEVFSWDFQQNPEAKSYGAINHVIFLNGKEEPVVDGPWEGQKIDPTTGAIIGPVTFPIRVSTLTYITDEAIPPSDSAICRPQVDEQNQSRSQVNKQRERSIPMRWMDINRVDPAVQQMLMRGQWQNFIPVQGDGARVIGEIARSAHPQENMAFDRVTKNDLAELSGVGSNQGGSGANVETAEESANINESFQTRIGRERAKVGAFFLGIAEVLGGLMCRFEDPAVFGEGFDPNYCRSLKYSILADSTVLVDSNQKLKKVNDFFNMYAKTGFVNIEQTVREVATLVGLDPMTTVKAPEPKPPVEPNISLRLTGAEDMMNPLLLAFMLDQGQGPKPELIEMAKQLIQQAVAGMPQPPQPPSGLMGPDGQPMPPGGPEGTPPGGGPQIPPPPPPAVGDAHPNITSMPKVTKRTDDLSGGR